MSKRSWLVLPSPALMLSLLALILALGGTALAAGSVSTAKKHSDAKQDRKLVKKMAKSLSVKHAKTAGSATHASTANSASHATTATSATSATNATHATNADHATTADLLAGYEEVTHQVSVPAGLFTPVTVSCSAGKKVVGGGYDIETPDFVKVFGSEPSDGQGNLSNHQWTVIVENTDSQARQATVSAICAAMK